MKNIGLVIISLIMSFAVNAQNQPLFKHIKINNKFATQYLQATQKSQKSTSTELQDNIYKEIQDYLSPRYQEIGQGQANSIQRFNQSFNLGQDNYSGFSWQKPFGNFSIYLDRQLSPDLFDVNRWIIQDTFTISIKATSLLGKLRDDGMIDMSNNEILAFAGIDFYRTYTTYHYASSYSEGLFKDFSKLFLPFIHFNKNKMQAMNPDEVYRKEDDWTFGVGGVFTSPSYYGFSASAGVLGQINFHKKVSFFNKAEENGLIHVQASSKNIKQLGASASLQVDIYNLIKVTLLQFDLAYSLASEKTSEVKFSPSQFKTVLADPVGNSELSQIIGFQDFTIKKLEPYVNISEDSESTSLDTKAQFLLWGRLKKTKTEKTTIIKDQVVKEFFTNYNETVRISQNLLSRLMNLVIYRLIKWDKPIKNATYYSRRVDLEYENVTPQSSDPNKMTVLDSTQFSSKAVMTLEVAKTDGFWHKKHKDDVLLYLERYTPLKADFRTMVRNEELKGPIKIVTQVQLEKGALDTFVTLNTESMNPIIADICENKSSCVNTLRASLVEFKNNYQQYHRYDLALFKNFYLAFVKHIDNLEQFEKVFGTDNVFFHGALSAVTKSGQNFTTSYVKGQFKGLGIIENFYENAGSISVHTVKGE